MERSLSFVECLHSKNIFWYFGLLTILHAIQLKKNLWMNKENGIQVYFKNNIIKYNLKTTICLEM